MSLFVVLAALLVHQAEGALTAQARFTLGQAGSFTSAATNLNGGPCTASNMFTPQGVAFGTAPRRIYVGDQTNARVLAFQITNTSEDAVSVFAQDTVNGDATQQVCLKDVTASLVRMATDVFVDSSGVMTLVYSSDISNNRVVVWVPGQRLAIDVYGPPTFTSSEGGTTRSLMKGPRGIGANTTHIFICDAGNSRIMIFPKTQAQPPHSASDLLGQSSFTATVTLPTTAQTFAFPIAIKFDDAENFYVVDEQLHRVLFFPANTRTATRVYGQPSMVSSGPSAGRNGLNGPRDAVLDEDGNLLVTDSGNNRIMIYAAGSTTAIQVVGQPNYNAVQPHGGRLSGACGLFTPSGIALVPRGAAYIADTFNNRVVVYGSARKLTADSLTAGGSLVIAEDVQTAVGSAIALNGNLTILGDFTVLGSLSVSDSSVLTVSGDMSVQALNVTQGATVAVKGVLSIAPGALLQPVITLPAGATSGAPKDVQVVVATFGSVTGAFTTGAATAIGPGVDACTQLSTPVQTQTASALSVTVTVSSSCGRAGLSTPAIVGISVGAAVLVAAAVVATVGGVIHYRRNNDALRSVRNQLGNHDYKAMD